MIPLTERNGAVVVPVKVVPGASRPKVTLMEDRLKVCVAEPPEKGKANTAVLKVLGSFFGAPVVLVSGASSPRKIVAVSLPISSVQQRLERV